MGFPGQSIDDLELAEFSDPNEQNDEFSDDDHTTESSKFLFMDLIAFIDLITK